MTKKGFFSVSFHTLGCKLNQAESEELVYLFLEKGYRISDDSDADIHIINTCTVTHIADRKARHMLRFIRKNNPDSLIAVIGCGAERDASVFKNLGADIVIGNTDKLNLPDIVDKNVSTGHQVQKNSNVSTADSRVRSFIKIQDGCSNFCTYCIVPYVRSREYSVPADEVIRKIRQKESVGFNEVVLTGTRIGRYNEGLSDLKALIKQILDNTGIKRLHLSSLQPGEINPELVQLWNNTRLIPHFHLALQSGSRNVLSRMKREYSIDEYSNAVSLIRSLIPQASITTDIMVGFPGETEEEFRESLEYCRRMGFAAMHVFAYSARPGTLAAETPDRVPERIKKERSLRMLELAAECSSSYQQTFIGATDSILIENEERGGSKIYSGFSRNYIRVYVKSTIPLNNIILPVKLTGTCKNGLLGEPAL